jgi:hypothetical protein
LYISGVFVVNVLKVADEFCWRWSWPALSWLVLSWPALSSLALSSLARA